MDLSDIPGWKKPIYLWHTLYYTMVVENAPNLTKIRSNKKKIQRASNLIGHLPLNPWSRIQHNLPTTILKPPLKIVHLNLLSHSHLRMLQEVPPPQVVHLNLRLLHSHLVILQEAPPLVFLLIQDLATKVLQTTPHPGRSRKHDSQRILIPTHFQMGQP